MNNKLQFSDSVVLVMEGVVLDYLMSSPASQNSTDYLEELSAILTQLIIETGSGVAREYGGKILQWGGGVIINSLPEAQLKSLFVPMCKSMLDSMIESVRLEELVEIIEPFKLRGCDKATIVQKTLDFLNED